MRKNLFIVSGIIILCISLIKCETLEKAIPDTNHMEYEEVKYPLKNALTQFFGKTEKDTYEFDFYCLSKEIIIHDESGKADSASGVGEVVYFKLFTRNSIGLKLGNYEYDPTNSKEEGTFSLGLFAINYDMGLDNGKNVHVLKEGNFMIQKVGDLYNVRFNGIDQYDKELKGYFLGKIKFYNHSESTLKNVYNKTFF